MKIQIVRYNNKLMLTLKDKGLICVIMSGKDTRELISISKEKYVLFNRLKEGETGEEFKYKTCCNYYKYILNYLRKEENSYE